MPEHKQVYANDNGVRRTLISDDERPGEVVVQTEQVLDEILDGVARDRELQGHSNDNRLVARIPVSIYERSVIERWDEAKWAQWLNSAEAAPFRVWRGQV